jgi:hypothetical protein
VPLIEAAVSTRALVLFHDDTVRNHFAA